MIYIYVSRRKVYAVCAVLYCKGYSNSKDKRFGLKVKVKVKVKVIKV